MIRPSLTRGGPSALSTNSAQQPGLDIRPSHFLTPSRIQGAYRSVFSFFLLVPFVSSFPCTPAVIAVASTSRECCIDGIWSLRTRAIWAPGLRRLLVQRLPHTHKHTLAATNIDLCLIPIFALTLHAHVRRQQAKHLRKLISLCVQLSVPHPLMLA